MDLFKSTKMQQQFKYWFFLSSIVFLTACGNTRYLPQGEKLYVGATVKIENDSLKKSQKKELRSELKSLIRPKPNSTFLGLRPKLMFYNIAGTPKKKKGFRFWLKTKVGQPPVIFSYPSLQNNELILQNKLENEGFFNATVTSDTTSKKRKVKTTYTAFPGPQFMINKVNFNSDSSLLGKALVASASKSFIKPEDPYNLDVIKLERERIDKSLKEDGYCYFSPDYLLVKVDSNIGNHRVNLYITIKPETPIPAQNSYTIGDVYVFPNFSLTQTSVDTAISKAVLTDWIYVIDKDSTFNPSIFSRSILFRTGNVYKLSDHNHSLSRLVSIGTFKFVKTRFERNENATKPTLNVFYYLTPLPRKSLRGELLGTTKSNNLTGSELSLSWKNRNIFRGAEQLQIKAYGGFEIQISGTNPANNTYRIGTENTFVIPRFVVPFFETNTGNAFVPKTKFSLGYEILNKRKLYTLNSFRASAGYNWNENIRKEHELNWLSINYVQPANVSQLYLDSIANNITLAKSIEKQFIIGSTYSFTYSDQLELTRRNNVFFNGNIDLAGNIPGLIQGADCLAGDTATLIGARYSQYIKADIDLRYYIKTGTSSKIASRIIAGMGCPYGNSSELPFIKQFFAGGSNSIRAFRARSVGPGTYHQDDASIKTFVPDQSGDIKLEMNTEYRMKFSSIINAALFVDAGNIWLFNTNVNKPGSKFSKAFLNELAVGTGIGLRFDFSFLILRTDLAFPVRKPWLASGDRWVFNKIDLGYNIWRRENLVFNIAIGYPF